MRSYRVERRSRSHQLKLTVTASREVVVIAPPDCPTFFIDRFVRGHEEWIEKTLAKVARHTPHPLHTNEMVLLFGKRYERVVDDTPRHAHHADVMIKGEQVLISPVTPTDASVEASLTRFLKSTAEKYIVPRTHQLGKKMGISFRAITLREQKTRWGSCSSQGNLNFNWRLVHCPPEVIDYVIIHELSHRKQMNHSAKFWEIVRQFDPEREQHRGWLKRHSMAVD